MQKKLGVISNKTKNAQDLKTLLLRNVNFFDLDTATDYTALECLVVIGGDGTMLHSIHRYMHLNIPFYGINKGSYGFLMNKIYKKIDAEVIVDQIKTAIATSIYPLQMEVTTVDNKIFTALAINEVSLLRQTYQTAKIEIAIDHKIQLKNLISDGVMLATPSGSTAYNLSAGGAILPLNANLLALTPISPFRPRRWHGALLHNDVTVTFRAIDPSKRPLSAVADFHEVRNANLVTIKCLKDKKITILFNSTQTLEDRIKKEQFLDH
jgi:NAD+ kinase